MLCVGQPSRRTQSLRTPRKPPPSHHRVSVFHRHLHHTPLLGAVFIEQARDIRRALTHLFPSSLQLITAADVSRPKSATGNAVKPGAGTAAVPGAASRPKPKPAAPKPAATTTATATATTADAKKPTTAKAPVKASTVSKPPRPASSASAPDLKNVRSKIGSTDNIKHQPGGGKVRFFKFDNNRRFGTVAFKHYRCSLLIGVAVSSLLLSFVLCRAPLWVCGL